ncbi:hypothetical protein Rhopal_000107-T1 [Rhodotorula paludigena]|uniref:Uncharacterized protein n=1 Tax=Rhodotorula paludigena TaxID=86838 RepID=A0AAV5GCU9_9BASI|nr:hypothetical protein Rhopal_000107-T1 [Rhodotorula paludigena]
MPALSRARAYRKAGYATEAPQAAASSSHLLSGLLGGGVALGGVYAYYSMSGAKDAVDTARSVAGTAKAAKDKVVDMSPSSAKEALNLAKSVAKSYAAAIPGGAVAIDQGFEQLENFLDTHGERAAEIVKQTYADVAEAAKGGKDAQDKVIKSLQQAVDKVQKLVGEEASKGWEKLGEKYPELQKTLGEQGEEFKKLTDKHGPEAQRIATDFYAQSVKIVSKGGFNAETYDAVKKLLAEKKDELSQFSVKAGRDAWDASAKAAGPALDKMPDVKEALDKNLSKIEGYVGEDRIKIVKDLYAEVEKIGKSDKSIEEKTKAAKDLVQDKLGDSSQFKALGLDKMQDLSSQGKRWLEQATGLTGLTKVFDEVDIKALKDLAQKRGDDAEKIMHETYAEIKEILQKQAGKAKKLGEETKDEAKSEAKSEAKK